jgi:two-component system response regulator AtoC
MKFLLSSSLELPTLSQAVELPPAELELHHISIDGIRQLVAAGESQSWDALLIDAKTIPVIGPFVAHLSLRGCVVIVASGQEDISILTEGINVFTILAPPLRSIDLTLLRSRILSHQQQKQGAQQERTIRKGKHLQFVAASPAMKQVISLVHRFAPFSTTVTLLGESGTGKEVVARLIHEASNRNEGPFVAVNCGAIVESLIESELFGHKRGAFTDAIRDKPGLFEEASGGTLFLDEIAELSLPVQAKLLRVLQEQRVRPVGGEGEVVVNARVIAATLKDLEREVAEGRFREDLFYRIHVVTIHLPPLRQRPEDIVELAQFFLKKHRKRHRLGNKKISQEAMNRLMQYPWRGNVRELENCIERSLILSEGDVIDVSSLPSALRGLSADVEITTTAIDDDEISIKKVTQEIEITLINRALERTNGNRTQAAKLLEISHRALLYKIKEYGLGD